MKVDLKKEFQAIRSENPGVKLKAFLDQRLPKGTILRGITRVIYEVLGRQEDIESDDGRYLELLSWEDGKVFFLLWEFVQETLTVEEAEFLLTLRMKEHEAAKKTLGPT